MRSRFRILALLGLTAFAALVASAVAAGETLKGIVGPRPTITLKKSDTYRSDANPRSKGTFTVAAA